MADFKILPPRQADFRINLNFKDLAKLASQGIECPEVMSFFTEEELHRMKENIDIELNARENKGE